MVKRSFWHTLDAFTTQKINTIVFLSLSAHEPHLHQRFLFVRAAILSGRLTGALIACLLLEGWIASSGQRWLPEGVKTWCNVFLREQFWCQELGEDVRQGILLPRMWLWRGVADTTWRNCGYLRLGVVFLYSVEAKSAVRCHGKDQAFLFCCTSPNF